MKIQTKAPNFALTKELNENIQTRAPNFGRTGLALARKYDVDVEKYSLGINTPFVTHNDKTSYHVCEPATNKT
jgi:hypothetical protein